MYRGDVHRGDVSPLKEKAPQYHKDRLCSPFRAIWEGAVMVCLVTRADVELVDWKIQTYSPSSLFRGFRSKICLCVFREVKGER